MLANTVPVPDDLDDEPPLRQDGEGRPLWLGRASTDEYDYLQEILRDRETLAAMATHDLREPIQAIQSFISVILKERIGPINAIQRDFLTTAYVTSRRLERLVEDVQVLIQRGQGFSIVPEDTNLYEHATAAVRELRPTADVYGVELIVEADEAVGWSVWIDPLRLDQILLNLIENAIRYSAADTEVRVSLRRSPTRMLVLVTNVTERQPRDDPYSWFAPFQRGDHARRAGGRGLGLGLTVIGHLVRAHGGHVLARSRNNRVTLGFVAPRRTPSQNATAIVASPVF
jgi:signal transduction histidine kinase